MQKPFLKNDPLLPVGLTFEKASGVFWWTRPRQPSKRRRYAVCVQNMRQKLEVSVLPIVGHLERKQSPNTSVRTAAMGLLVRSETEKRVFRTVYAYAQDSNIQGTCDAHWFLLKADSPQEARNHPDVAFVLAHIRHYRMTHAFRGIYFISNGHGAVKIGCTGSSLASRLNSCQVGSPHELYVVAAIEAGDIQKTERRLHKQHKSLHIRGEWFAMDDDTAIAVAESLGGRKWDAASLEHQISEVQP